MVHSDTARDPVEELAEEFLQAFRRGEQVSVEQYAARLPESGSRIRDLFPTLLMVESLKPHGRRDGILPHARATQLPEEVRSVGDFRIVREIGRGGMGVVYEAVQESLQRRVALKVMSHALFHSPRQIERFEREARSAARLHHTNIIPVFGIGHKEGIHYFVMQYIEGQSLAEVVAVSVTSSTAPAAPTALRGNWKQIARLGQQIASALCYAHGQGVLHRDIKPANLLLDARGNAWIGDFGLAKATGQDEITLPGNAMGTLRYMPPEQLDGGADERSDIYSFGLTLYELLTWRQAFDARDRGRLVRSITQGCPVPPRRLEPSIPRDLETIVLKAIARDPESRYQTAAALSDDLQRYIDDKPVRARRAMLVEQLWRWSQRNPLVARLTCATVVLSLLVAIVACFGFAQTRNALLRESQQKQQAMSAERQAGSERERAEANLRLALAAFNEIARDLAGGREPAVEDAEQGAYAEPHFLPLGSHDATVVLRTLLKFYAEFAAQNGSHPQLQHELVQAHRRLGDIHRQFGHANDAERAYRQALALCAESDADSGTAAAPSGEARSAGVERASLCIELGTLFHTVGRFSDARAAYKDAHLKLASYLEAEPESSAGRFELARLSKYRSDLLRVQGQIDRWGEQNRQAIRILSGLVAEDASNAEYRFLLACAHRNRPPFLRDGRGGSIRQEFKGHDEAIRLLTELSEEYPDVPRYGFELSETYALVHLWKPGPWRSQQMSVKELKGTERRLRKALALCRKLVSTYPAVPDYADALASNLVQMGTVKERLGELEEAEKYFTWATTRAEMLVKRFESVPKYNDSLALAGHSLGRLLRQKQQFAAARPVLESSIACRRKLVERTPQDRRGREMLALQYEDLLSTLRELGETQLAEETARKSRALRHAPPSRQKSGQHPSVLPRPRIL